MSDGSRSGKLAKRKKTNLVLNGLIAVVVLLIIFVSGKIFFGDSQSTAKDDNTATEAADKSAAPSSSKKAGSGDSEVKSDKNVVESVTADDNDEAVNDEDKEKDKDEKEKLKEEKKKEKDKDKDKTAEDGNWEPVGTVQDEHPSAVYDKNSVDWQEMLKAISSATGVDSSNMTVLWLGNNGGPNSAAGTISANDSGEKYKVEIEWVDGKGWKPVGVEELGGGQ
ncbi:DUF1510 family protein [Mesobacillus zeae]|uniref:DUF1510 family protein n=2 Tax=Mesobacillus zeae TaxID=1917180 RepID=A0A398B575_9BACI|nr:DUF1510 family protein [Mesobacillus zeae]